MNLPEQPLSAVFVNERIGHGGPIGSTDRALVAVMRFDRDGLERLKAHGHRLTPEERSFDDF